MICRYELKEYLNKRENQITLYQDDEQYNAAPRQRTTQRRTQATKSQQKTTKRLDLRENHLFRLKAKKENMQRGDFKPKKT
jgi:DNA integrity scanning protein DisA with diadenylate cyclase activity